MVKKTFPEAVILQKADFADFRLKYSNRVVTYFNDD